ncbi:MULTISPECIES: ATP-dependent DNA helicase [unclassified Undibacterium]|uniref:ATP-dependent DNA helicase n=1 Tax=unclassified Undibacterium TaxID=2630295 RepID=UPI002AC9A2CC|nr:MULTISPECIES: ATP-dependent DNA helicase [unclassified Undibacterium]MEB0140246.1 ATP-dependent DNA helicase [Undibacterium sp. CCC2.1]MEB0173277.1 ATP-dependent DNA helicase [Undibacterium sp. CCC1.1]MEB0177100.1 ATP-dependent DNA helicase [Undibacterium sp. CCC3.4]MEB0216385.1 ATP-dependent DNA helicase [Undibacterium sp. 5I2]WPX42995.1 ATP-dependent DNA helicase [Undibacterium sp. CCC3.4]
MSEISTPVAAVGIHDAEVEQIFSAAGPLSAALPGYRPRAAQTEMAKAIARAISGQSTLLAEAGTGTGKTYAYLAPALLWGGKVIVSTGTKNLQDQLFSRDIPTVKRVLQAPVSVALLKGRSNYLCHYHLERTLQNGRLSSREDIGYLRDISRFMKTTSSGDKAELARVPETASVWALVTSTKDTCMGSECQYYQDCFVMKARKEAQQADIVVVNHHLFFADVALKDTGIAELLPSANTVIFDEAHQLPETATLFFGDTVSTSQILELCRDVQAEGLSHARDGAEWSKLVAPVERAARDLRLAFPQDVVRLAIEQIAASSPFFEFLEALKTSLAELIVVLEQQAVRAETLEQCRARTIMLNDQIHAWNAAPEGKEKEGDYVLWVEAYSVSLQLHRTPLSIAPIFNKQREGVPRTWIFTSATMAVKNDFTHFVSQMGLWNEPAHTWPSPFNYQEQGFLYVPNGMPEPNSRDYADAVVDAALPVIIAAGGRTFLLCTTLKAVKFSAGRLKEEFDKRGLNFPLFVQGDAGRTELLDRFRAAGNGVLIGSQSFWEGVDVRGEALSLVIIDKLPFSPPDDPVLAARITAMEKKGLNGFVHHQLPEAIINLKQGAGRLIRDETDVGVLMICDPRLISKPYGKRIWQSLPAFTRTRVEADVIAFFENLKPGAAKTAVDQK